MEFTADNCETCGTSERSLWGPTADHPELRSIAVGNWIELAVCDDCQSLWCSSPYEPYAAYKYSARWVYSVDDWQLIHDADEGATLREWLTGFIHDNWTELPTDDQTAIKAHDQRASGHSPIRDLYQRTVDLEAVLAAIRGT